MKKDKALPGAKKGNKIKLGKGVFKPSPKVIADLKKAGYKIIKVK